MHKTETSEKQIRYGASDVAHELKFQKQTAASSTNASSLFIAHTYLVIVYCQVSHLLGQEPTHNLCDYLPYDFSLQRKPVVAELLYYSICNSIVSFYRTRRKRPGWIVNRIQDRISYKIVIREL